MELSAVQVCVKKVFEFFSDDFVNGSRKVMFTIPIQIILEFVMVFEIVQVHATY